ncbi:GLPGLI family protein [Psychroflexus sp. ALD_RP9]|uniref:GLPGLI family protein n=1 Tax=Psychroflexus sp. ALD_RP9 TaxID=2777186 RepID=UPI001A8E92BF|nr:GLPGLI family protein [Psychroflexus sp. ALD_RP9]QSS97134.1 GLPGLI family protein [Psychroflexus sp. ALD_RP9]
MKILLILLIMQASLYAQTYEATYQFKVNKAHFKAHIKKKMSEGTDPTLLKKAFNKYLNSRPAKAKLVFNAELSFYEVVQDMGIQDRKRKLDPALRFAGGSTKYYREKGKDSLMLEIHSNHLDIKAFLLKIDYSPVTLLNDTKQIGKYQCYLAEVEVQSKYNFKLWYAPNIPTNFNVLNYGSLPGLLIKIESKLFTANLISFKEVKASALESPPTNLPQISLEAYQKMIDKVNPFKDN